LEQIEKLFARMENNRKRKENRTSQKKGSGKKDEASSGETPEESIKEKPKDATTVFPKTRPHRAPMRFFSSKKKG